MLKRISGKLLKTAFTLLLFVSTICTAQEKTESFSSDWINVEGKSEAEVVKLLQNMVEKLRISERDYLNVQLRSNITESDSEAADFSITRSQLRNSLLENQRKLSQINAQKTQKEKEIDEIRNEIKSNQKAIATEKKNIERNDLSKQREKRLLRSNLDKVYFTEVVVSKIVGGRRELPKDLVAVLTASSSDFAIGHANGMEIISETIVENNMLISDFIKGEVKGYTEPEEHKISYMPGDDESTIIYAAYKYKIYPLGEHEKKEMEETAPDGIDRVENHLAGRGHIEILDELKDSDPAFIAEVNRYISGIDNKASVEQINRYIQTYRSELKKLEELIKRSEDRIQFRTSNVKNLNNDLESEKIRLSEINQKRMTHLNEFTSTRNALNEHLNNEIYTIFLKGHGGGDLSKTQDDVYKEIIEKLFGDFRSKVQSYYSRRTSEVQDFVLIKDEKFEGRDDALLTDVRILGFFRESDRNISGRIYYELAVGYKYRFKDKFYLSDEALDDLVGEIIREEEERKAEIERLEEVRIQEEIRNEEEKTAKRNRTLKFLLLIPIGLTAVALIKYKPGPLKPKIKQHFGNAFKIEGSSVVVINGRNGANIKIGRKGNAENDISFKFPDISRKHLSVKIDDDILISDNSSSAGTYINGNKIEPGSYEKLENNSVLQIADFVKFRHIKDRTGNSVLKIMPLTDEEKEQLDEEVVSEYPNIGTAIVILKNRFDLNPFLNRKTEAVLGSNGISFHGSKVKIESDEIIL